MIPSRAPVVVKPPPPRPWWRKFLLAGSCLLAFLWALPWVASGTRCRAYLAQRLGARLNGSVSIGRASLGWFSGVVLRDLEVRDASGRRLALIGELESEQSLLSLLFSPRRLGTLYVRRPQFEITCAGRRSDLEQVFEAEVEKGTEVATGEQGEAHFPEVRFELVDAGIKLTDLDRNVTWNLYALQGTVQFYPEAGRTLQVNVEGSVKDTAFEGSLKVDAKLQHLGEPDFRADLKGRFANFPLAVVNLLPRRFRAGSELTGYLDGQCQISATFTDGKPQFRVAGDLAIGYFQMTAPYLEERLCLSHVQLPCRFDVDGKRVRLEQAEIVCDLGKASLRGELELDASLDRPGLVLSVNIDLARTAEKLPRTLRLHRDIHLTAGRLNLQCRSSAQAAGTRWEGCLDVTDLHGLRGEREVAWTEPIRVDFQARRAGGGLPLLDQVHCASRFLRVDGATRADGFALQLEANLEQLMEPLSDFVDLGPVRLAGQAHAHLAVKRHEEGRFAIDGSAALARLDLNGPTGAAWQEETMVLEFAAQGRRQGDEHQLTTATANLRLGSDRVELHLPEPGAAWEVTAVGELARWQQRCAPWTSLLAGYRLAGAGEVHVSFRPGPDATDCRSVRIAVRDLQCVGSGLNIREPELVLQAAGRWGGGAGSELGPSSLRCSTLTLETERLRLLPGARTLEGAVTMRGDVARFKQWVCPAGTPLTGTFAGRIDLDAAGGKPALNFDLLLTSLALGPPHDPTWHEPLLKIDGHGALDLEHGVLQLARLHGASQYLRWDAQGKISDLAGTKELDVAGQLAFDLEKLEPHLRPYLGPGGRIVGSGARPFSLTGPLAAPTESALHLTALKGQASLSWSAVHMHGFDVGPAELRACLQKGWFQLFPVDTTLNGGRLLLQPNIRLEPGPAELVILPGQVLDKAQLTPELLAGALGYLAPTLANAAQAEGLVSLELEGGRLPLGTPASGEVKGTLILHSARIGPGPMMRELAPVLRSQAQTNLIREARVPFHLVNGRVHHQNLELAFPDLIVRSSGSVGLDGSLALVLEMPIPPRWLGGGKLSAVLANKNIRVPVGGTLDQPRLDQVALRQFNSQLVRDLTGDGAREELQKGLQRLLRPR